MAAMIGRGKSWLLWTAGFLCALAFGRGAPFGNAGEVYGVRAQPARTGSELSAEDQQRVDRLLAAFLAEQKPHDPDAELAKRISGLVGQLGDDRWDLREAATDELGKIGRPALAALRETLANSKDPEVLERAKDLVARIESGGTVLEALRAMGQAAKVGLEQCIRRERRVVVRLAADSAESELAGRDDEADKLREQAKKAQERVAQIARLLGLLEAESSRAAKPD
jgi:hypothetical protein